jgi:ribosomal protein S27AE
MPRSHTARHDASPLNCTAQAPHASDIYVSNLHNTETWNDCPRCGVAWADRVVTPGLIHRTRLCPRCASAVAR